jgi:hypothetical protein
MIPIRWLEFCPDDSDESEQARNNLPERVLAKCLGSLPPIADSVIDEPRKCNGAALLSVGECQIVFWRAHKLPFELAIKKTFSTESNSCNQQTESYTSAASKFQPLRLPQ